MNRFRIFAVFILGITLLSGCGTPNTIEYKEEYTPIEVEQIKDHFEEAGWTVSTKKTMGDYYDHEVDSAEYIGDGEVSEGYEDYKNAMIGYLDNTYGDVDLSEPISFGIEKNGTIIYLDRIAEEVKLADDGTPFAEDKNSIRYSWLDYTVSDNFDIRMNCQGDAQQELWDYLQIESFCRK